MAHADDTFVVRPVSCRESLGQSRWLDRPRASAHRGKWGQLTPWQNGWKSKKRKHAKKSSFLCLCYILRAIRAGRCRERRYADHIFIQIYFRMHRPFRSQIFKILFASGGKGGIDPLTKILRTFLIRSTTDRSPLLPIVTQSQQPPLLSLQKIRSSAIAEGPRDASCQLKSCQLPRNSAETTCTTKSCWTNRSTTPTCNGRTDRQTDGRTDTGPWRGRWKCETWNCGTWKCGTMLLVSSVMSRIFSRPAMASTADA